jgi:uncharacterized membrane protein YbhN (UPF0104 family)
LWIIAGLKLHFCIHAITDIHFGQFYIVLAAASASLLSGLLAIFAPAGFGVNEGVGTLALSQIVLIKQALLAMILSRLIQLISELSLGMYAFRIYGKADAKISSNSNIISNGIKNDVK